ncbi:MAG: DUF116 domain-containing protein [Candidatus Cloacimonetes bacterium]|jgi:hypothetical protein|nr:DUF116 domain-containing protein [Candidatus Cloacimonadota bacterium]MDD2505806.1 DUF116 domain-containing protein [Candidatus Cloacimonadota bacterium]MDD4147613.1 DUF116 domain-containing protein [Candidatus Cloacimonadota bacterium]MDD4559228.1 DUF116 domain-containing protein [Candidatus Cloacimonadota bacterium]
MKQYYLSVIKFPLMVSSTLFIIALIFFSIALSSYFKLGLSSYETLLFTIIFVLLVILVASWILNLISTHSPIKPRWMSIYAKWMLMHVFYYIALFMATITMQKKSRLQESFVNFNNEVVLSAARNVSHKNILLLVPHCLQNSECNIRITSDINECASCGKCDITEIKKIAEKFNVKAAVASGGSLARKIIKDVKPDVIVAVACHHDLNEGIRDAWRFSTYGVLNERPNGPCFETTVSLKTIEFAIRKFQ